MLRACVAVLVLSVVAAAQDAPPRCLDDRLQIELFAEQPDVVTPTGIDVDHLGRVFVIESNTHFPPDGYEGHPTDRVLILENTEANPQADKVTVFADGLVHTMSIAVEPIWLLPSGGRQSPDSGVDAAKDAQPGGSRPPLRVFIATRSEILLLTDTDGDSKADEKKRLVHLETAGNYPHNGLAGFAFDALGNMFFGFGENLGADYKIIGSDGTTLSGGGEGGNLYRCKPDGSKLERWATGFWNPHASCFDAFGRLFTVDNDPDSRPPCRLLHIIPGGDYGYRFRNGRKGTHPFTSWNGELPGTLPMVAGTGEAPSGIVCYENDGFPADYLGTLLVGSWGDHRIDQFVLEPKGASFTSKAKPIIQGGENFRPVGLAVAPDGSLYFSDWVLKDYKLHGKGRVWRVSGKPVHDAKGHGIKVGISKTANAKLEDLPNEALVLDISNNLVKRRMAARALAARKEHRDLLILVLNDVGLRTRSRVEALWALMTISHKLPSESFGSPQEFTRFPFKNSDDVTEAVLRLWQDFSLGLAEREFQTGFLRAKNPISARMAGEWIEQYRPDFRKYNLAGIAWGFLLDRRSDPESGGHADPFLEFHAFHSMKTIKGWSLDAPTFNSLLSNNNNFSQLYLFLLIRERKPQDIELVRVGLKASWDKLRFAAVQWIGEEKLQELRPNVEALLADPTTTHDLFLACLATLQLLDGKPASEFEKQPPTQYIAALLKDANSSPVLRATALRMLPANAPELDAPLLTELLSSPDETLRIEAARTLAGSQFPEARELLLKVAANSQASIVLRAEAVGGLCNGPHEVPLPQEVETLLLRYARGEIPVESDDESKRGAAMKTLQLEALRSLRGRSARELRIREAIEPLQENRELKEAVEIALHGKLRAASADEEPRLPTAALDGGDATAGRRVFFHHNGPLCSRCHTVQGRGGQVGPDLTVIARTMDRDKLLASILEPSKEIAPQFTTWIIETTAGKTHTGFILEDNRTGQIKLGTATGEVILIDEADIETREPSKLSVMPEKLHEQMTSQELRDLLAFFGSLK